MTEASRRLAALIDGAERIVAFTGAGISTESGIPDFRSPGGIWSKMAPIDFDDFVNSEAMRREAWRRNLSGVQVALFESVAGLMLEGLGYPLAADGGTG